MKTTFLLFMTVLCFSAYSQKNQEPTYYLNSTEIEFEKLYIQMTSIDSIHVNKQTTNGEIYLFTKNKEDSFISLSEILKSYTALTSLNDSILIIINGDVINDISNIKIDETYFIDVEVSDISKAKYLSDKYNGLKIVNIILESEERKP